MELVLHSELQQVGGQAILVPSLLVSKKRGKYVHMISFDCCFSKLLRWSRERGCAQWNFGSYFLNLAINRHYLLTCIQCFTWTIHLASWIAHIYGFYFFIFFIFLVNNCVHVFFHKIMIFIMTRLYFGLTFCWLSGFKCLGQGINQENVLQSIS